MFGKIINTTFEEVSLVEEVIIICDKCGRKKKTKIKVCQTINPFNKNADGEVKQYNEIMEELKIELPKRCVEAEKDGYICEPCKNPEKIEWLKHCVAQSTLDEMVKIREDAFILQKEFNTKLSPLRDRFKNLKKVLKESKIQIISDFKPKKDTVNSFKGKKYMMCDIFSVWNSCGFPDFSDAYGEIDFGLESWDKYKRLEIKDIKFI